MVCAQRRTRASFVPTSDRLCSGECHSLFYKPGLISLVERRRRWSIEEKLAILVEALASGASVSAVADRHGVARGLLYTCLRLTREGRM
jgi:Transposase